MRVKMLVLGTAAMSLTPGLAAAAPAAHPDSGAPQTNAPTETGQPGADCEELVASLEGSTPGQSATAPGSAFNPDGNAGTHYAGEQPQNSKNPASVSQYDVACLHGTR